MCCRAVTYKIVGPRSSREGCARQSASPAGARGILRTRWSLQPRDQWPPMFTLTNPCLNWAALAGRRRCERLPERSASRTRGVAFGALRLDDALPARDLLWCQRGMGAAGARSAVGRLASFGRPVARALADLSGASQSLSCGPSRHLIAADAFVHALAEASATPHILNTCPSLAPRDAPGLGAPLPDMPCSGLLSSPAALRPRTAVRRAVERS